MKEATNSTEYCGYLDTVKFGIARGWACNPASSDPVLVEVLSSEGGTILGEGRADKYREDLKHIGMHDGRVGFEIEVPTNVWKENVKVRVKGTRFYVVNQFKEEWNKFLNRFTNSTILGIPKVPAGVSSHHVDDVDIGIAREIIEYAKAMSFPISGAAGSESRMWDMLQASNFAELLGPLKRGDAIGLARAIVDCPKTDVSRGMLQGHEAYRELIDTSEDGRNANAALDFDALLAFAQYLGVERLDSAEQSRFGNAIQNNLPNVLSRVEASLGVSVAPPQMVDGLFGLALPAGSILHSRDVQGLYLAHRTIAAAGKAASVCEIGGGLGKAAYYAWLLGIRKYTIVDLSMCCLLQYFFLRRAIPEATVAIAPKRGDITIVPTKLFLSHRGRYGIAVNSDSFPEMGNEICRAYFDVLSNRTALLLSINQEANCPLGPDPNGEKQSVVGELLAAHLAYRRAYRHHCWVRKGYAEELWVVGLSRRAKLKRLYRGILRRARSWTRTAV